MVVGVICFSEKHYLSVTKVECLGIGFGLLGGDIFDFGGFFIVVVVEMDVDHLELEIKAVVRLVWSCVNEKLYFLCHLRQMSLEGKVSNVGGCPFGMMM